jgi:very-short-patch-repair endonuclease
MVMLVTAAAPEALALRLAAAQFHVVAARQLVEIGMHRDAIAHRTRNGTFHRITTGVYAVGVHPSQLCACGWQMAAILRHRVPTAITGATAATHLGIWNRSPSHAPIEIVTRGKPAPARLAPRVHVHTRQCRSLLDDHIVVVKGMPTMPASDAIIAAGSDYQPLQLTSMLRQAHYLGLIDIQQLRTVLDARPNGAGTAAVRRALEQYLAGSAGTRSASEDEFVRLLEACGLPTPLVNVRGATGVLGLELDFVWPRQRLIVEIDGGHHDQPGVANQDLQRDEALRAAGWIVLRVRHAEIWSSPAQVMRQVQTLLGH